MEHSRGVRKNRGFGTGKNIDRLEGVGRKTGGGGQTVSKNLKKKNRLVEVRLDPPQSGDRLWYLKTAEEGSFGRTSGAV